MRSGTRERWAKVLSLAAGAGCAHALFAVLHPPPPLTWPSPPQAKVMFRAAAAPLVPAPDVVKTEAVLPLKVELPVESSPRPKRPPPSPTIPTSATAPETESTAALPSLVQPPLPTPVTGAELSAGLPVIGQAVGPVEGPPVPSDIPEFRSVLAQFEKPGGDIAVIAVLVNDASVVVDVILVVPSNRALEDITLTLSQMGQRWDAIDPPLLPGEYRWLELRINQATLFQPQVLLP